MVVVPLPAHHAGNRFLGFFRGLQKKYGLWRVYDNPIPTQFLAPIDCSKIPALVLKVKGIVH
jgi:hypothetical protein